MIGGGNNPSALADIEFFNIYQQVMQQTMVILQILRCISFLINKTVFACGYSPGDVNTIDFITIASGGTAQNFGDNTASGNSGKDMPNCFK